MTSIRDVLAEIAREPPERWPALLAARFPGDPALVAQGLLWLRAEPAQPVVSDRYVLGARLDAGATAEVWQAFDRKLGRNIAIKLFHEEVGEALAEARAACDVISDHVVRVLDVHDGYIVMELVGEHDPDAEEHVPGGSAARLRPRTLDEAVRWVRDVARGVHDAHLRDVFHRDLKPHNVLITPVSRRARIADFGLAASRFGGARRIAGTPEYMAPEQARGVDPGEDRDRLVAIDVWGLGALAYDLIGGRAPWAAAPGAASVTGAPNVDAWERAAAGERPALPARTPWGERIPARLARVIDKAMAEDPAARYASAAEVARDLDAYLAQRPTSLDRSHVTRAALWARRNPQLSLTAAAALALAGITLAGYASLRQLRVRSHALAQEVREEETTNAELAARMAKARKELEATEADVHARSQALAALQSALEDEQKTYEALIAARDRALQQADATTKQLVDQLAVAHSDRAAAELGRSMYEGFWNAARAETAQAAKDRDQAQHERDAARSERDQLQHERDAARDERDRANAEVQRLTGDVAASRRRIDELTRLLALTPRDAGVEAAHDAPPGS